MALPLRPDEELSISQLQADRVNQLMGIERPAGPWNSAITPDAAWHFAAGVGDDNPLWWNVEYAKATPWGRAFAPPTFLTSCSNGGYRPGEAWEPSANDLFAGLSAVWTTDSWRWEHPAWVGSNVTATSQQLNVVARASRSRGKVLVQTERTLYRFGERSAVCATNTRSFIRFKRQDSIAAASESRRQEPVYPPERVAEISARYLTEASSRRGAGRLDLNDIEVGARIPALYKGPLTLTNIIGWLLGAGCNMCPTNRIAEQFRVVSPASFWTDGTTGIPDTLAGAHWNLPLGGRTGFSAAYDFGSQRTAWFVHCLTDWIGDSGFLREITVTLKRPVLAGDLTEISGEVIAKSPGDRRQVCTCALAAVNQHGEETARAEATVWLAGPGRLLPELDADHAD
jgi:acyl dehydratase